MDWDLPRSSSSVHLLAQLATERGLTLGDALEGTGVTAAHLRDPQAEVTGRQEIAIMRKVIEHCGDEPGLGIEAGRRYHITMYGAWGLALISSATLRDTIGVALRYLDLAFAFTQMSFEEVDGEARLIVHDNEIPPALRTFLVERIISGIQTIALDMASGGIPLSRVTFRHPPPDDISIHRAVFGVEPEFDAERNMLVLDAALLDFALPQADEWAVHAYESLCEELVTKRRERTGLAGAVRSMLLRSPGQVLTQAEVAAELHLSRRTLFRRLSEERTSFRGLLDEVRETLAEELLCTAGMTTEQVSSRLGYAEPACFVRAFKRWKGVTPQAYRSQQRGPSLVGSVGR